MAKQEQLNKLMQGVGVWNKWRKENPSLRINLSGVDLREANLREANLREANLSVAYLGEANLSGADLSGADLSGADLSGADLSEADLSEADLSGTDLHEANLGGANLREADLHEANLNGTDLESAHLRGADLTSADLIGVDLSGADLWGADLGKAISGRTNFTNIDLSSAKGLESVGHLFASNLGTNTLLRSKGKIPEIFWRGCGLSDWEIASAKLYNPDLINEEINKTLYKMYDLRATQALQISPLFISYSHADGSFVDRVEKSVTTQPEIETNSGR